MATLLAFAEPKFADDFAEEFTPYSWRRSSLPVTQTLTLTAACKLFDNDC